MEFNIRNVTEPNGQLGNQEDPISSTSEVVDIRDVNVPTFLQYEPKIDLSNRKVITVVSPGNGGVGKSTVSAFVAMMFSDLKYSTVLIDVDMPFGDISTFFKVPDVYSLSHWIKLPYQAKNKEINKLLYTYSEKLKVIPSIQGVADQKLVNHPAFVKKLFGNLQHFQTLVIDAGPNLEPITLESCRYSSHILVVSDLDETSLQNVKKGIKDLESQGIEKSKITLVLNRLSKMKSHQKTYAQGITGIEKVLMLPYEKKMSVLMKKNKFDTKIQLVKQLHKWKEEISPPLSDELIEESKEKWRFFKRLTGARS